MHLALLGKTLDDLKAEYMGTSESADAISNKQLDGVWVMAGTPNAAVTQIMTTTDAKILPIPAETAWISACVLALSQSGTKSMPCAAKT